MHIYCPLYKTCVARCLRSIVYDHDALPYCRRSMCALVAPRVHLVGVRRSIMQQHSASWVSMSMCVLAD